MPLILEIRLAGRWQKMGELALGEQGGSLSHNPPGGPRQIYRFDCLGEYSRIERSKAGTDFEVGSLRAISSIGFEEVARLDHTNPHWEFWLRTDGMPEPHEFRFRHE